MSKEKVNGYECVAVFNDNEGNKLIKLVRDDGQVMLVEYTGHVDDEITFDTHYKSDCAVVLSKEFKDLLKEDETFHIGDAVMLSKEDLVDNADIKLFESHFDKTLYIVAITNAYDTPLHYGLSITNEPKFDTDIIRFGSHTPYGFIESEIKKIQV